MCVYLSWARDHPRPTAAVGRTEEDQEYPQRIRVSIPFVAISAYEAFVAFGNAGEVALMSYMGYEAGR
jgi:hypothetical protein